MKLPRFINRFIVQEKPEHEAGVPRTSLNRSTVKPHEHLNMKYRGESANRYLSRFVQGYVADAALFNARNLSAVPLRLFKRVQNEQLQRSAQMSANATDAVEITDHEILRRLRKPDPDITASEWHMARWMDKQLYGAYYLCEVNDDVHDSGTIYQVLNAGNTEVQLDKNLLVGGYYYWRDPSVRLEIPATKVMSFRNAPHPHDPHRGLGWLEPAIKYVELANKALDAEINRWENGGYPSVVLSLNDPNISPEQFQAAYDDFMAHFREAVATGSPVAVQNSTLQLLSNTADLQTKMIMDLHLSTILDMAGIPDALYTLNDANLASASAAYDHYARTYLSPVLKLDAEQLTEKLLPKFDLDSAIYYFQYDDVIPQNEDKIRQDAQTYVPLGVLEKNEIRAELGYDPLPDEAPATPDWLAVPPTDLEIPE